MAALTAARLLRGLLLAVLAAAWWWGFRRGQVGPVMLGTVATIVALMLVARGERRARERHIDATPLPRHLRGQVRARYPALDDAALARVERGLRQFFHCHLRARRFVAMPSQAVDALWHAFILDTRAYQRYCAQAFGAFLHHSPAETLGRDARRNDGLRRTWFHACRLEGIDPRAPAALPLLFALDTELAIPGGHRYVPDCRQIDGAAASGVHCGSSFADGGTAGDADGFGGEAGGADGGGDGDGGGSGGD